MIPKTRQPASNPRTAAARPVAALGGWLRTAAAGLLAAALAAQPFGVAQAAAAPAGAQVRLLRSDASGVLLELEIPGYQAQPQVAQGQTYLALSVPGLSADGEPGWPQLPVAGALVGAPPGAQARLSVMADEIERVPLAYPPLPAPTQQVDYDPALPAPRYAGQVYLPDPSAYSAPGLVPGQAARLLSDDDWRSQRVLAVALSPLQYDPAAGELVIHRRLQVEIAFTYPPAISAAGAAGQAARAAALGGPRDEGPFDAIFQGAVLNYDSAKNWREPAPALVAPQSLGAALSGGPWYKIAVDEDGLYRLTCDDLFGAGIDTSPADFLDNLQLHTGLYGDEIAVRVVGTGQCDGGAAEYVEFFGQAVDTLYTGVNLYWLTYGDSAGLRMPTRDGTPGAGTTPPTFTNSVHLEQNVLYQSFVPDVESADHWYWNSLTYAGSEVSSSYTFQPEHLASGVNTATLTASLQGLTTGSVGTHHTLIRLNGVLLEDAVWYDQDEHKVTIPLPPDSLLAGTNTIIVTQAAANVNVIAVNYFDIDYESEFTATDDVRRFRQETAGTWLYEIDGFGDDLLDAFDITDPLNVTHILNPSISGSYTLQFEDEIAEPHEYLALTEGARKTPLSITLDAASDLKNTANAADYIIIAHGDFLADPEQPIQELAAHRQGQGLDVEVVDVQDVYDEFSRGLMDAQAIRDFLEYAYENWQSPAPAYVLLVGDGTYDLRNYKGTNTPTFIPPYLRLVDPWIGETASDNRLVSFDDGGGNTLPLMAIGRLPANSAAEVQAMVAKILANEQSPPAGRWRNTVTFVSDNAYRASDGALDGAGNFWEFSDEVASSPQYMGGLLADRIYFNPCDPGTYPQCELPYAPYTTPEAVRPALVASINDGRLIVNYVGHGSTQEWAHESLFGLLTPDELPLLTNANRYPVILAMTCYEGSFHLTSNTLAEAFVRLPDAGALASWSASGLGVATGHDHLDQGFFDEIVNQGERRIGPATVAGKANLWAHSAFSRDLVDTFNLLGDPASVLALQFAVNLPLVVN